MKKLFNRLVIIIFASLIFNNCQQNISLENMDSIVESVKVKFAPDKRVAIFNITVEREGDDLKLIGETDKKEGVDELMNELEKLNYNVKNEVNILPDKELGEKKYGIVNLSVANIRSKPQHSAELATQSLLGTCVNVLKKDNGWFLIQTPDKYISWVDDDGIHLVSENEVNIWKKTTKVIITEQYSIAYANPNKKGQKISDLVIGDILKKVNLKGNYTEIEFPDGRRGFVLTNNAMDYSKWIDEASSTQKSIINTASDYMGLPYLWGGTSAKALDCSGFTKTVYYLNGVVLPRDASQQVHIGELVNTNENLNELERGDLLFFGRKATEEEKEKVTHVAIYIGDKQYIHAAGRVRINSLDKNAEDFNQHRLDTFIRARRIIGSYDNGKNLIKNNTFYN
jgi:gamma-D-glutamyl-L-lysine dipeptidyl-peptidase